LFVMKQLVNANFLRNLLLLRSRREPLDLGCAVENLFLKLLLDRLRNG
jgi:hypothetical protein